MRTSVKKGTSQILAFDYNRKRQPDWIFRPRRLSNDHSMKNNRQLEMFGAND